MLFSNVAMFVFSAYSLYSMRRRIQTGHSKASYRRSVSASCQVSLDPDAGQEDDKNSYDDSTVKRRFMKQLSSVSGMSETIAVKMKSKYNANKEWYSTITF
jgi:hypothetical protein